MCLCLFAFVLSVCAALYVHTYMGICDACGSSWRLGFYNSSRYNKFMLFAVEEIKIKTAGRKRN